MASTIEALGQLRRSLEAQRRSARASIEKLNELRHRMIVARVEGVYRYELARMLKDAQTRILAILAATTAANWYDSRDRIRSILTDLENAIIWYATSKIYEQARNSQRDAQDDLLTVLTVAQLRRITQLPIDATGNIKPKPGVVSPLFTDTTMTQREILLRASPLLVIPGDTDQTKRTPLKDLVFGQPDLAKNEITIAAESVDPQVSAHWRNKLRLIMQDVIADGEEAAQAIARLEALPNVTKQLQLRIERARESVLMELQHEGMRTNGAMQEATRDWLPTDIYSGYTLHSRFYPTTAPDHAARDGWKFYRDDRPGGNLPWQQRLIPPYRKNCLCFTVPILEDPDGEEYHAEFGVRISGGKEISIRDVGTWQTWFDNQLPSTQQRLVGQRRWMAAASRGLGKPKWGQFVRPDGRHLSVRNILNESDDALRVRLEKVRIIGDIQHDRYSKAWADGFGKFDMNPYEEAAYRRRLDIFLRRALKRR